MALPKRKSPRRQISKISLDEWNCFTASIEKTTGLMLDTFEYGQKDYAINEREAYQDGMRHMAEVLFEAYYAYFFDQPDQTH